MALLSEVQKVFMNLVTKMEFWVNSQSILCIRVDVNPMILELIYDKNILFSNG
jgi:hypothetical protein